MLFLAIGAALQSAKIITGFLSAKNFLNIIDAVSLLGIVAAGMAFITFSGHFADMSAPTTMALTGIVAVEMLQFGFWPAIIAAFATGIAVGIFNGFVVGKLKANPIIWTLAVNYVSMGIIRLVWVNKQIYPDVKAASEKASHMFDSIYRLRIFNVIAFPTLVLVLLILAGQFILTKTKFGAQLKLAGSARRTAKFTGINVERVVATAFLFSALTATMGGLAITSLGRVGAWYNGAGYDFKAVTAIVIGGMTLAGGRGTVFGVLGGALVMGLMNNIMTLLGIGLFTGYDSRRDFHNCCRHKCKISKKFGA